MMPRGSLHEEPFYYPLPEVCFVFISNLEGYCEICGWNEVAHGDD